VTDTPPDPPGTFISKEEAKAVQTLSTFGATVVTEASNLARYAGRILGTVPEDAVSLVIGDPLHFVRTAIAGWYDQRLDRLMRDRNVEPQPVSPSIAIPLIRAAYDEGRPELQELWAQLIASAMDPTSASRVRRSFIDTLQKLDPLDARVLQMRRDIPGNLQPNSRDFLANRLDVSSGEVEISAMNLVDARCGDGPPYNFNITAYGIALLLACSN
jgi:hypothetical protein